jgi:putative NADH-flavin reductase
MSAACARHHHLRVVARATDLPEVPDGVVHVDGPPTDKDLIHETLEGCDAVVSAIEFEQWHDPTSYAVILRHTLAAMRDLGIRRIVALSTAALKLPGDHGWQAAVGGWWVRTYNRNILAAKRREWDVLRSSELDWSAYRAVKLIHGAVRPLQLHPDELHGSFWVQREAMAELLLDQLEDERFIRKSVLVG